MENEQDIFSLRISEAFPEDEGVYKCVASNASGTISTTAHLFVIGKKLVKIYLLENSENFMHVL